MKTTYFLLLLLIFGTIACTDKWKATQGKPIINGSVFNHISIRSVKKKFAKTHPVPVRCFTPPAIRECGDVEESIPMYPEPIYKTLMPDSIPEKSEVSVYFVTEEMPSFPGGDEALRKFIAENLQYPDSESCIQGRVVLRFVVDKQGYIKNVAVIRSLEHEFDKEAVRVVKSMPRWNIGKQNGIPVDVYYTLPIVFRIPE